VQQLWDVFLNVEDLLPPDPPLCPSGDVSLEELRKEIEKRLMQ
jgi:hypothetical protein